MENDNNVNGNLNDNSVLDALVLTGNQWKGGIVKAVIFTLFAVIIFFVPVTVGEARMSPSASYIKILKLAWDLRDSGWADLSSWETAWPAYTENTFVKTGIQLFTGTIRRIRCCIRCFT